MAQPHLEYPTAREMSCLAQQYRVTVKSADDAAFDDMAGVFVLGSGVDIAMTCEPAPGMHLTFICPDSTADATVTAPTGFTFDGTNDKAALTTNGAAIEVVYKDANELYVIRTEGTVTYS